MVSRIDVGGIIRLPGRKDKATESNRLVEVSCGEAICNLHQTAILDEA